MAVGSQVELAALQGEYGFELGCDAVTSAVISFRPPAPVRFIVQAIWRQWKLAI
jgi:hypothetical protein